MKQHELKGNFIEAEGGWVGLSYSAHKINEYHDDYLCARKYR